MPTNAYIEFEYVASQLVSKPGPNAVYSGMNLIDEEGKKYRIDFVVYYDNNFGKPGYSLKLPGGASAGQDWGHPWSGKIHIQKTGDTLSIWREGDRSVTAKISDFKKFTRFEVDMYKGPNSMIQFTNFKIGIKQ